MRTLKNKNENGILITYKVACERYNLGMNAVRRLARDANACIKIGKSVRVDREKLDEYIFSFRN